MAGGVLRYEVLGRAGHVAFATPLASGHDFQGWADAFPQAPITGLQDASVQLQWRTSPWRLDLRYHGFWEAVGRDHLGSELDLELTFRPVRNQPLALGLAEFRATAPGYTNTGRIFLTYSWNF